MVSEGTWIKIINEEKKKKKTFEKYNIKQRIFNLILLFIYILYVYINNNYIIFYFSKSTFSLIVKSITPNCIFKISFLE